MSNLMKMSRDPERQTHTIGPVYDEDSRILILGSFPSVKSREAGFFYGHPQNRFWRVLSDILESPFPDSIGDKRALLQKNHIALWDVIASCTICGSSDVSIRDVTVNDLGLLLKATQVRRIFTNGGTSDKLYRKYLEPVTGIRAVKLPSTSPANAAWSVRRLEEAWKICLSFL